MLITGHSKTLKKIMMCRVMGSILVFRLGIESGTSKAEKHLLLPFELKVWCLVLG